MYIFYFPSVSLIFSVQSFSK